MAVRGGKLKKMKKLEGGWGGGRGASPPDALGVLAPGDQRTRGPEDQKKKKNEKNTSPIYIINYSSMQ